MSPWAALRVTVILIYVFMLGPILITAAVSFNESNRSQFPPRGFSLQWWQRALSPEWIDPLWFSFKLGALTALISTLLALPLAFALRTVAISLHTLPPSLELAAASLGASPWRTLWHVVFPLIKSGIVAGAVFAFVHSFTDVNLSLFLVRPGEQPITVKILGFLEFGFAPTLAAVSVITLLLPLVLVAVVERLTG